MHHGKYRADPATQAVLDKIDGAQIPPMDEMGVQGARDFMNAASVNDLDPPEIGDVADITIDGPVGDLALRIYQPAGRTDAPMPVLVYFHGGGFVIGDLNTHDAICRMLVHHGNVVCVSVDYRLAPEHIYPAAVEDSLAAWDWVRSHAGEIGADPARIAAGGDSAGGNLAAILGQHARDKGANLTAQLLLYPVVDFTTEYNSHIEHAETPPISKPVLDWFWASYFGDANWKNSDTLKQPWVSPILTEDFTNLAPAFVLTAGLDPLRDEGAAYAEKLSQAGVETIYQCVLGTVHGFLRSGKLIPATHDALIAAGNFLRVRMI